MARIASSAAGGPEGDLGDGQPAGDERAAQRVGVGGVVEDDDRDQPVGREALQDLAHSCSFAPGGKAVAVSGRAYAARGIR